MDFFKIKENNEIENLTGEQRRETEDFITKAIGSEEDFLSTILTTGNNLEELIESKPTARGLILTRFLGLEILKDKEEICKLIQSEWSKKLVSNNHNITDLESANESLKEDIENNKQEILRLEKEIVSNQKTLKTAQSNRDICLSKKNNDVDKDLIKTNVDQLTTDITKLKKTK